MGCHQDRINHLDRIKPYNRHIGTHASHPARRQGKPCPKAAIDCNRLQWTAEQPIQPAISLQSGAVEVLAANPSQPFQSGGGSRSKAQETIVDGGRRLVRTISRLPSHVSVIFTPLRSPAITLALTRWRRSCFGLVSGRNGPAWLEFCRSPKTRAPSIPPGAWSAAENARSGGHWWPDILAIQPFAPTLNFTKRSHSAARNKATLHSRYARALFAFEVA
jgi:hypothetical protein